MEKTKLRALTAEFAKDLKTEADLNRFMQQLTKLTVETALNAELQHMLVLHARRFRKILFY